MPDFVADALCLAFLIYGGSLWRKPKSKKTKQSKKVKFIVVREFLGDKTMQEAFEQLIERQTCEHFEEWLERKAS